MRKQTVWITLIGAVIIAGSWGAERVNGQEERKGAEQIDKLRQQVKELVEAGRDDEARLVKRKIGRLEEQQQQRKESGDKPDLGEAKRRLAELTRNLEELKEQDRGDEAERVARQIEEIRQRLERSASESGERPKKVHNREQEKQLTSMKQRIAELHEAGRYEEADRLMKEVREMIAGGAKTKGNEGSKFGVGIEQRIDHLREAAKHLYAAGQHDTAVDLIRQAERMMQESDVTRRQQETQRGEGAQLSRRVDELSQALRNMHQNMERLEKQMHELSERIERQ